MRHVLQSISNVYTAWHARRLQLKWSCQAAVWNRNKAVDGCKESSGTSVGHIDILFRYPLADLICRALQPGV